MCTRRSAKLWKIDEEMTDDVEDLVQKMSDFKVAVTTRQASRSTVTPNREEGTHKVGVRTRYQTRLQRQVNGDLDVQESEAVPSKTVRPAKASVPVGLENPGNMCFANAILQSLAASPIFVDVTKEMTQKNIGRWMNNDDSVLGINVLFDIGQMIYRPKERSGKTVRHGNVLTNLHSHNAIEERGPDSGLGGRGQQDAHEFLQLVIFSLQRLEDLCASKKGKQSSDTSQLNKTLSGTTHVTRTCTVCRAATITEDIWNIQTLFISSICKELADCFHNITKKQILDGKNMVNCEKCKRKTKTHEQSRIMSSPDMLIVHFNLTNPRKNGAYKLRRTVAIPTKNALKVYSPTTKRFKKVEYELTAVVMHHGNSTDSGHYTCYVQTQPGQWYNCNDGCVTQVQESRLPFLNSKATSTSNPYLLFLTKAST